MPFSAPFRHRRVLVTGHTGFKGSWLTAWLLELGAEVPGLSLPPATDAVLFDQLKLAPKIKHRIGDIRDLSVVRAAIEEAKPDFVFNLAAQVLVRLSYEQPVETYATNVMGTVNVLEAVRFAARPCTVIAVTTDKCYENKEWLHSYREEDPLGGYDPYSSSKGAAEIAIAAYRRSYFSAPDSKIRLASARAGNVIGGADWAQDRILPDCIRSLPRCAPIPVRNKIATRPWQHVLEPLSGYLWLAVRLSSLSTLTPQLSTSAASAFNFGPELTSNRTVAELVQEILKHWPGRWEDRSDPRAVHEAKLLNLAIDKAYHLLQWRPVWNFSDTIEKTVAGYRAAGLFATSQIAEYTAAARTAQLPWSL